MSILPDSREAQIAFFETRIGAWATHAASIGLLPGQTASLSALISAARGASNDAVAARAASKAATVSFHTATDKLVGPGRDYIATIKAYAETTGNPNVYALAQIDPPAPPTPVPAPATPTDLRGAIDASGVLTLAWDAAQAGPSTGIIFIVSRKGPASADFSLVGATFEKRFVDPTFAACDGDFAYRVQARRGSLASGFAGPLLINLGGAGDAAGDAAAGGTSQPEAASEAA